MSAKAKKNKKNTSFSAIAVMLGSVLAGFFIGTSVTKGMNMLFAMFCLLLSWLFTVIIHEAGHLVMGFATGYKFVSFRVGSLTLIRLDGKLKLRTFSVLGTAGQCLMMPHETDEPENHPYFLYHFGGGLFNIIAAAVCGVLLLFVNSEKMRTAVMIMFVMSLVMGISNLIPIGGNKSNDGTNLLLLKKYPAMRRILYQQLMINGLMYQGMNPIETPDELLYESPEDESVGVHKCVIPMLKASVMLGKKQFSEAEEIFRKYYQDDETHELYQLECTSEIMFCMLMNRAEADEIDAIYDKKLKSYVTQTAKTQISKRRLLYAYKLLHMKDSAAAEKEYKAAMKMKKSYPCIGEYDFEFELINYVKANFS